MVTVELKAFIPPDWWAFAGAEKFVDGQEPLSGEGSFFTVVADSNGMEFYINDPENPFGKEDDRGEADYRYSLPWPERLGPAQKREWARLVMREVNELIEAHELGDGRNDLTATGLMNRLEALGFTR